jgi:hypothetical protein
MLLQVINPDPDVQDRSVPLGQNGHSKAFFENAIASEWRSHIAGIIRTGDLLNQAEDELDRDVFRALKLPFTLRVAQMLRRISGHPFISDPANHGSLPPCWRSLYELTKASDDVLEAARLDGRLHPDLQRKDIRTIILGLPPRPSRGSTGDQPFPPAAMWELFTPASKREILAGEGRAGLAKLVPPELMADLAAHSIRQEMIGASTKLKPAVTLTAILRTALDPAGGDSGTVFERFKAKLKGLGLDLRDISIAVKAKRGKR